MPKIMYARSPLEDGDDVTWKHVPVEVVLPAAVPAALHKYSSVYQITGEPESMLKAAVRTGCFLTVKIMKKIHAKLKFTLPEVGSGSNGNCIKIDYNQRHFRVTKRKTNDPMFVSL